MTPGDRIRRARAVAQRLHRPSTVDPVDVVAALLAVQAQDIRQAPLALRARAKRLTASAVAAARADGRLVRAWGPRGTIHLMTREDVGWLTALVLPSSRTAVHRRLAQEGVDGTPAHLLAVVERALAGGRTAQRAQPLPQLHFGQWALAGQGIVYLAFLAAVHGKAVFGPERGAKPTYVHSGDWLGRDAAFAVPDRPAAMAELAVRYLRAHGPSAPEDLAAWSGQGLTQCRAAFAAIDRRLRPDPDHPLWTLKSAPRAAGDVGTVLVPAFDEYLLGWRDRTPILDPVHTRAVVPGGGIIRPAVVSGGFVVGTWQGNPVRTNVFSEVDPADLAADAADVQRFLAA